MSSKIEKVCLFIIRWGSYLILFLPLLVYRQTLYPYIFGKIICFRILVEIIFAAWLFLVICPVKSDGLGHGASNKQYRPNWKHPLVIGLTIFMGILVITMFIGIDIQRSFWSSQERMTGVLTLLHFWLWFLILTSTFGSKRGLTRTNTPEDNKLPTGQAQINADKEKGWNDWRKLIWASLICSFLVGLYGLGQKFGLKFLLEEADMRQMSATLGNPIFLGVYSMLHIFFAGWLLIQQKKWFFRQRRISLGLRRGLVIFFLVFNLVIMVLTATRGVTITLGISFFLFSIYLIFTLSSRKAKLILVPVFIILIAAIIGGAIFLQTQKGKSWIPKAPTIIRRIVYLEQSAEKRMPAWQAGIEGFREKPILGWGWENYNIIFNKNYHPFYLRQGQEATWFDHSHNQIIDLLSLTGILGTIAYLSVFAAIFWLLLRKNNPNQRIYPNATNADIRENSHPRSHKLASIILGLMLLAYFIQNLTVFDTPCPLIVFYFGLGLVYYATQNNPNQRTYPNAPNSDGRIWIAGAPKAEARHSDAKFPLPILIFLIIIFLPWGIYKFNLEPFQQSHLGFKALSVSKIDFKTGLNWYKKALAKPVFTNPEIRMQLAKTIAEQQGKVEPRLFKQGLDFAISEMEKNTQGHPLDVRYWLYLGQLYNLGADFDLSYTQKAEEILKKALELSPKRQQIYFELSRIKIIQEKYDEAIEWMEKAVALDDQVKESLHNLGLVYLAAGQTEKGLEKIENSYYSKNINTLLYIAGNYAKLENYKKAVNLCSTALKYDPKNLTVLGQRIIYWAKLGNTVQTEKELKKLNEINPDVAEQIKQIISQEIK